MIVVVNSHLVKQWEKEFSAGVKLDSKVVIAITTIHDLKRIRCNFTALTLFDVLGPWFSLSYGDIIDADVVIVSVAFLSNKNYLDHCMKLKSKYVQFVLFFIILKFRFKIIKIFFWRNYFKFCEISFCKNFGGKLRQSIEWFLSESRI
jgi:hypothetical protein